MDEDLHRLALTMRLLGRPQGELLEPRVEKGLFLSRCIPEDVAAIWSLLAANCLSQEDDVCVLFEEASRSEPVPPLDVFASLSGLPLPLWAKRLQHVVLTTATCGGDGWGVELFRVSPCRGEPRRALRQR